MAEAAPDLAQVSVEDQSPERERPNSKRMPRTSARDENMAAPSTTEFRRARKEPARLFPSGVGYSLMTPRVTSADVGGGAGARLAGADACGSAG